MQESATGIDDGDPVLDADQRFYQRRQTQRGRVRE
ncbi:hypothetical protein ABH920_004219 [Catenulispora sp. EB89]